MDEQTEKDLVQGLDQRLELVSKAWSIQVEGGNMVSVSETPHRKTLTLGIYQSHLKYSATVQLTEEQLQALIQAINTLEVEKKEKKQGE